MCISASITYRGNFTKLYTFYIYLQAIAVLFPLTSPIPFYPLFPYRLFSAYFTKKHYLSISSFYSNILLYLYFAFILSAFHRITHAFYPTHPTLSSLFILLLPLFHLHTLVYYIPLQTLILP